MKLTAFLLVPLLLLLVLGQASDAQNLAQLSYGEDTVVINRPTSTTPAPVEVTTKKKGFFSGLKKYFGGGGSSTTEAPVTPVAPSEKTDINGNVLNNKNIDTIEVLPQSPTAQGQRVTNNSLGNQNPPMPIGPPKGATVTRPEPQNIPGLPGSSQVQTNAQNKGPNEQGPLGSPTVQMPTSPPKFPVAPPGLEQTNKPATTSGSRDYVNPNFPMRPPSGSVSPPPSTPVIQLPSPAPPSPSSGTRDYVNPNFPMKPPSGSVSPPPSTPVIQQPLPPAENKEHVNPNLPTKAPSVPLGPQRPSLPSATRDYVNPNIPAARPSISPNENINLTLPSSIPAPISPGSRPISPQSTRDYINPNRPIESSPSPRGTSPPSPQNRRDYVNPNIPLSQGQAISTSSTPQPLPFETTLNPADFPPLDPPRRSKPSRRPGRPNSPTRTSNTTANQGSGQQPAVNQLATDQELSTLSEALYAADNSNVNTFVTINYQGKTYSGGQNDDAPLPLLQIDDRLYDNPTVSKMRALFDNYILDASVNEYIAPNERIEENEFLDAVMATPVMRRAMLFLQQKGIVTPDPVKQKEMLKTIWFTMYSRGKGKVGSSGFEHVFLAEMKDQNIMGLHNWLYYAEEERKGTVDYKGWIKKLEIAPNNKALVKYRFAFHGITKPVNGMFIGTSPELELALYTVCFQVREGSECPLTLNGHTFNIRTYSFRYRGKNLIGSAFPEIMAGQG